MQALRGTKKMPAVLRFLTSRNSYSEHPRRLHLTQTHASWVVLSDRFVYKVKKPVNFGFLDFSTLKKRRHFCEREVFLNRRLCPGMYLGVIPVRRRGQRLTFGSEGKVVEYAVKMRRLTERYFLLRILEKEQLTKRHIDRVIEALKPFYTLPSHMGHFAKWGRVAKLRESTSENFRQTRVFFGKTVARSTWEAICSYTEQFYHRQRILFQTRARQGCIRDCHGDLHLDHVHVAPDKVCIYDCIEFNERFRIIDVASDLAFLAMDLDFHGRADLGEYFVTRMANVLRDPGMLSVLDFYKCYRACVRGKVESLRSAVPGIERHELAQSQALARRYFRLALQYAIGGSKPMVLIVMGQVATGKSTLARSISDELGWSIFASDSKRKELAGVSWWVRGNAAQRAALYSRRMSDRTYARLSRCAVSECQQGRSVILDATFAERDRRTALRERLEKAGIDYCFIETRAWRSAVRKRLADRADSEREVSDARLEDYPALARAYESPKELISRDLISVRTTNVPESVLTNTLQALARRRATLLLRA